LQKNFLRDVKNFTDKTHADSRIARPSDAVPEHIAPPGGYWILEEDFSSQSYREVSHETGNKVSVVQWTPVALTYRGRDCVPRCERNQQQYFRASFLISAWTCLSLTTVGSYIVATKPKDFFNDWRTVTYIRKKTSKEHCQVHFRQKFFSHCFTTAFFDIHSEFFPNLLSSV